MDLLDAIAGVKRESRMARDNSEDALTWNVFRFLDQSALLGTWLESIADAPTRNPRIKYWSYCPDPDRVSAALSQHARPTRRGAGLHRQCAPLLPRRIIGIRTGPQRTGHVYLDVSGSMSGVV
jgi:hypothetical protein